MTTRRSTHRRKPDVEEGEESPQVDMVDLEEYLQRRTKEAYESGILPKKIGVSFENLTVTGTGSGREYVKTFPDELAELFGKGIYDMARGYFGEKPEVKNIIQGFSGVVKPGEMLLVLGRPGSGTSTFLRALTNQRRELTSITGDINYSGVPFEEAKGRYRGEIMFNGEGTRNCIFFLPFWNTWSQILTYILVYRGYPSTNFDSTADSSLRNADQNTLQENSRCIKRRIRRPNARSLRKDVWNDPRARHQSGKLFHSRCQWR